MFRLASYNHFWFTEIIFCLLLFLSVIEGTAQDQQSVEENERINARSTYIEGLTAFENENYQQALELLKAAYVKLPEHPGVNYALADAYLMMGDPANAEYYGKQAVTLNPENKWYYLKLVTIYREVGNYEAAIAELNNALNFHPQNTDLLYELAQTYSDFSEPIKANEIYNKLLNLKGEDLNIRLERLQNFNTLNMQDSALAELQKIQARDPSNISTLQVLSNYYLKMGQPQKAREALEDALAIDNRDSKSLLMLSDILIREEEWDRLDSLLTDAVNHPSTTIEEKIAVGEFLYSQFSADSSNPHLKKTTGDILQILMQSEPNSSQIQELGTDFFIATNQREQAIQALEKTTALTPTDDSAWQRLLQLLLVEGETERAVAVGEKAVAIIPQDPVILYFLGNAHLSNQNHSKAIEYLNEAADLPARRPLKSNILAALGNAHAALENWSIAYQAYEESLKIDSKNAGVLNNYAYYLSLQSKQLDKAKEMAQKAVEIDPKNASYLDTLGWIYYQLEEYEQALQHIRAATDTGEAGAEIMEHLGDVLDKLDRPEEAQQWWQKALDNDSSRTHLKNKISTNGE